MATELFGVSFKECQSYYLNHLLGGEDDSEQADGELKRMEGSTLPILFPEHYTWTIHFTHEAFVHTGVPVANGRKPTPKERAPTVERELANEAQPILRG